MVEPEYPGLSIRSQCDSLGISRSGWYSDRNSQPSEKDIAMMNTIDRVYTKCPWYGSRRIRAVLMREGVRISRKRVQRLMRKMGIAGVAPRRTCSRPAPKNAIYPYLLRNVTVDHPNQAWCTDITYLPLPKGFMYLVAVMDWHSRRVLSWELSNSLTSDFCVEALQDALEHHGRPEILNTDQGSQFTCEAFLDPLRKADILISMDGSGRWVDNVFIERLWRTLKYEDIYVRGYETATELREGLARFFRYYNESRPHQSLEYHTPGEVHRGEEKLNPKIGRSPSSPAAPTNRESILAAGGAPTEEGPGGPGRTNSTQP